MSNKITCECGSVISKSYINKHKFTDLHKHRILKIIDDKKDYKFLYEKIKNKCEIQEEIIKKYEIQEKIKYTSVDIYKKSKSNIEKLIYVDGINNITFKQLVYDYLYKGIDDDLKCNVIDALQCNIDRLTYNISYKDWISTIEKPRCRGKKNETNKGTFIQKIFGLFPNWVSYSEGIDLKNDKLNCIVELKNKYNTIKGSSKKDLYKEFIKQKKDNKKIICYYAYIIPQKPNHNYNRPWTINKDFSVDENIREICNKELSKLITGHENGIKKLYESIIVCFRDILLSNGKETINIDEDFFKVFNETFG